MEEKERYYSLIDNNGNFELRDYESNQDIYSLYELDDLLNQQDKRIKELEEENQQLKEENGYIIFADGYDEDGNEIHRQEFVKYKDKFKELVEENKQLKQSQKQLAISELEKIYNLFEPYENSQKDTILCANNDISFIDYLKNRIKELKGDKNEI